MSRGFTYANTNPAKPCNMLSGVPLLRPAHRVFGYDAKQKAEWALAIAVRDHTASERQYVVACAELGRANRCGQVYGRLAQRPAAKAAAFRMINRARAARRAALKALAAAQAAMLAFAPAEAA